MPWTSCPKPNGSPGSDSEFTTPGNQGEQGRMDLLTVLEHEIGHLLGHGHEADGVMQDALTAGARRAVTLRLNASGRRMLRHTRRLTAHLRATTDEAAVARTITFRAR